MITRLELTFHLNWWELTSDQQRNYLGWARAEWEPKKEKQEDKLGIFSFLGR